MRKKMIFSFKLSWLVSVFFHSNNFVLSLKLTVGVNTLLVFVDYYRPCACALKYLTGAVNYFHRLAAHRWWKLNNIIVNRQ